MALLSPELLQRVRRLPVLRPLLERRYERFFRRAENVHVFRGVYGSFAEALRSAPPTKGLGYDEEAPAAMYRDRLDSLGENDYPAVYWLSRILRPGMRVFDLGGHVGIKYYAFRRYLAGVEGVRWTVSDVPAVVRAGEELAGDRGETLLDFTTDFAAAEGADVLFCSGSLQYVETPLSGLLGPLRKKPEHVLLNTTALHDGPTFFTLNNIGVAYCPYRIGNRAELVAELRALRYELMDVWSCPGKDLTIPFHPERSLSRYAGMYLRRA